MKKKNTITAYQRFFVYCFTSGFMIIFSFAKIPVFPFYLV
jgi:hypothetical protein